MSLDLHVIPISAFIAGDYDQPEATAGPRGVKKAQGWLARLFSKGRRGEGLLYVEWLRQQLGRCPRWNEEGGARLSRPLDVRALHDLRKIAGDARRFPHLIDHADFQGFYLPVAFAEPRWIPDPRWEDHPLFKDKPELQKTSVGSAVELRQELDELKSAHPAWIVLDELVRVSLETRTPICLDG